MTQDNSLEEQRRRQILNAAEKVFADRGIDKARMDDIVEASGLAKGTLYWYYKSKEAIVHAIIDRIFAVEMQRLEDLLESDEPAFDRIEQFLRIAIKEIRRFEHLMPLGYEIFSLVSRSQYARDHLQGYYRQYIDQLAEIIRQGISRDEIREIDPQEAALAAAGLIEGIALYWFIDPSSVNWDHMEKISFYMLRRGLQP